MVTLTQIARQLQYSDPAAYAKAELEVLRTRAAKSADLVVYLEDKLLSARVRAAEEQVELEAALGQFDRTAEDEAAYTAALVRLDRTAQSVASGCARQPTVEEINRQFAGRNHGTV